MSLLSNNKKGGKKGNKQKGVAASNKFAGKTGGKAAGITKKPIKTGGARGS